MKRTTLIYGLLLLVSGIALWGILGRGAKLATVTNLAGTWTIVSAPLGPGQEGSDLLGDSFLVEQSGRFMRLRFEGGRVLDLRAKELPFGDIGTDHVPIDLQDATWRLSGSLYHKDAETLVGTFTLAGPQPAQFWAYRLSTPASPSKGALNKAPPAHASTTTQARPLVLSELRP